MRSAWYYYTANRAPNAGSASAGPSTRSCSRSSRPATPQGRVWPDTPFGPCRARLSFLPVLGLLVCAFSLFAATAAQAQTTVWSATLTARGVGEIGCNSLNPDTQAKCSNTATLSDDDFSHEGSNRTIISISYVAGVYFYIQLDNAFPQSLSAATLNVGSKSYPLSEASPGNIGVTFMFQGTSGQIPQLTLGSTVALSLVLPPPPVPVSLSASPNPVTEGESVSVTARLSRALAQPLTVPVRLSRGTAQPDDYGPLPSITIPAGATSGTGTVTTKRDADTDDETFTVALGSLPAGLVAGSPSSVRIQIVDLDASPVTHLATTPGHRALTVTWRNPDQVRSNAVRWRAQGTTAWLNPNGAAGSISASPVSSFTITSLTNGTTSRSRSGRSRSSPAFEAPRAGRRRPARRRPPSPSATGRAGSRRAPRRQRGRGCRSQRRRRVSGSAWKSQAPDAHRRAATTTKVPSTSTSARGRRRRISR